MVSIIITVVKDRGWLDEAIQSTLNQDYNNYEIILASDGNPDMEKYAKKYNLKFSLCKDGGCLSKNLNHAVETSKGKFFKILSDDDLLTPNCLTDLVKNIGDNPLIFANAINFGRIFKRICKPPMREDFEELLKIRSSYIHGGTILFKKDIFLKCGGYDEKLMSCEEYDYYLNLLSRGYEFSYVDATVYRYRKHKRQKSRFANSPERMKDKNYIVNKYQ